ncbi:fungal specific transcription factor domain-containing protein [Aspergillus mulundensis]|uniref:Putative Zn(II)2Cys6 transcription factor n=1 Tax=Aspergillus mulundensis TaxID=1810919 RepID=A0A3D8RRF7_9EURO|nr:putative Zn(II)2Cys6 transcription factor [Aspergillus mulundensis]RDW76677.1 putative Zn(II)2Cys6 transcription factor [Aspergillus mulundensis]
MDRTPSHQSSSYGQACTQCYKAKCRCVRTPSGDSCERCLRLKKRCEPSESIRRRNVAQNSNVSDRRIARLEDKMESLLSAMQSFIGSNGTGVNLNGEFVPSVNAYQSGNAALVTPPSTTLGFGEGPAFAPESVSAVSPNSNPQNPIFLSTPASSPNQDERLDFFRSKMLPSFPFIDLTPDMTSWYLRQNRPLLYQAICTVTTFSTQERLAQVEELKQKLFSSAFMKVESNIDLLLASLTYLAWSTDPFLGRADLVSRLMMLAISLVYDLRLFKPSSKDVQLIMTITQGRTDESPAHDETPISSHLGRQDALRWTPQMEEALRLLTISEACPADRLFVCQVRLQLLKQRADDARQQDDTRTSAPGLLYLKTLRRELQELRASFPMDLQQIDILSTHAQYVELYINQLAFTISKDSPLAASSNGPSGNALAFQRLECLWHSVENIKSWLDSFYSIPCSKLSGQPFHFWSQMILTITLLKYLSTLKDPDWDCQAVRNTVHLISTMDCMLQRLDLATKEPELQGCGDHLLLFLSKLLSRSRVWGEARWNLEGQGQQMDDVQTSCQSASVPPTTIVGSESDAAGQGQAQIQTQAQTYSYYVPDLDQMVFMQSMDLGDDRWFENVLGMPPTFY